MRNQLELWLLNWQAQQEPKDGVTCYEFANGSTVAPIIKGDSYSTNSICFLIVQGDGKPNLDTPARTGITYMGGGWFFYGVEIKLGTTRQELFDLLDSAKAHLLAGVKDHGKQVDAAGV